MSLLINGLFAQSLRLPREMRNLFLWGYAQKNNPRNIKHMPAIIFFACLDLERKFSLINRLIDTFRNKTHPGYLLKPI
jgi:hypothetical protein